MKRVKATRLPPGVYTVTIDRVRKVRNKPQKRIHMTVQETGTQLTETIHETSTE